MPGEVLLVVMAAVGALVIVVLGLVAFRVAGDRGIVVPPMPAAFRDPSTSGWCRGTLRAVGDRLTLKGPGGLAAGPWLRGALDLGIAAPLGEDAARVLGREGLIQVPVRYGTSSFDLALDEQHYTALRAWVEAAPPVGNRVD